MSLWFDLHFHNVLLVLKQILALSLVFFLLYICSFVIFNFSFHYFSWVYSAFFILNLDAVVEIRITKLNFKLGQLFTNSLYPGKGHTVHKQTAPFCAVP